MFWRRVLLSQIYLRQICLAGRCSWICNGGATSAHSDLSALWAEILLKITIQVRPLLADTACDCDQCHYKGIIITQGRVVRRGIKIYWPGARHRVITDKIIGDRKKVWNIYIVDKYLIVSSRHICCIILQRAEVISIWGDKTVWILWTKFSWHWHAPP